MKRFRILCLVLALLSVFSVFGLTACDDTPEDETPDKNIGETNNGKEDGNGDKTDDEGNLPKDGKVEYEITVNASDVEVDLDNVGVCLYKLDGSLVEEKKVSGSVAKFEVEEATYVATLSGLTDDYSFSSVLLKNQRKATIEIEECSISYEVDYETMDDIEVKSYAFTVFIDSSEEIELESLFLQVCAEVCKPVMLDENFSGDAYIVSGEYHIELSKDGEVIYDEYYTVTLDTRFYVIQL